MPERSINTAFWGDPFVLKLSASAKLLYIYLWTNPHCNQVGVYEIAIETMEFETKVPAETLKELLEELKQKVTWYPDESIIWVKNFLKHQTKSPKFLVAAAKCLFNINVNGLAEEVVNYNQKCHNIPIPYQYPMDRIPISPSASAISISNNKGVVKGEEEYRLVYEENIGMVTPIVLEGIRELCKKYPVEWFKEAVKVAVENNARNYKYVKAILDRWAVDGFKVDKKKAGKKPVGSVPSDEEIDEQERKSGIKG